jgi:hypothetical protein
MKSSELAEERGEARPGKDGDVRTVLGGVAAIDQPGAGCFPGQELRPPEVEAFEGIGGDGLAGFGFDGVEHIAAFDDGVDFMALLVAEEADGGHAAGVGGRFGEFRHHPVFKNGTPERMGAEVLDGADADEPGGKAGVSEEDFGGLDEAFRDVGEMRAGKKNNEPGLEHGQPRLCGGAADAGVRGERRDIDQLADATRTQLEEALEGGEILDLDRHPHIPFEVGGDVTLEPGIRVHLAVVNRREKSGMEQCIERSRSAVGILKFGQRKRPEVEQRNAARQRLGDGLNHAELLGAGQNEAAHAAVGIQNSLQVGKKGRAALDFIKHRAIGELGQEASGIFVGKAAHVRILKAGVGTVSAEFTRQGRFPRLARACDGDGRKALKVSHGDRLEVARD